LPRAVIACLLFGERREGGEGREEREREGRRAEREGRRAEREGRREKRRCEKRR
jgi:hypothetical protein